MTRLTYIVPFKPGDRVLTRSGLGTKAGVVKTSMGNVVRVRLDGSRDDIILPARMVERIPSGPSEAA